MSTRRAAWGVCLLALWAGASACEDAEMPLWEWALVADTSFALLSGRLQIEAAREGGDTTFVTCGVEQTAAAATALIHDRNLNELESAGGRCVLWLALRTYPSMPVYTRIDSVRYAADTALAFATVDVRLARSDMLMRPLVVVALTRQARAARSIVYAVPVL